MFCRVTSGWFKSLKAKKCRGTRGWVWHTVGLPKKIGHFGLLQHTTDPCYSNRRKCHSQPIMPNPSTCTHAYSNQTMESQSPWSQEWQKQHQALFGQGVVCTRGPPVEAPASSSAVPASPHSHFRTGTAL